MSGRVFRGKEAVEMGLFTEAVAKDAQEARVKEYIDKYSNGPTMAYGDIKKMINSVQFRGINQLTELEIDLQAELEASYDHKESVYAFLEKRPAKFIGK